MSFLSDDVVSFYSLLFTCRQQAFYYKGMFPKCLISSIEIKVKSFYSWGNFGQNVCELSVPLISLLRPMLPDTHF